MGIIVNLQSNLAVHNTATLLSRKPSNLIAELAHYQKKTEQLKRIYDLHKRLSQKLDLSSMVEEFSIWLAGYLDHELVAYRHWRRGRSHMTCSSHGPKRQELMTMAQEIMQQPPVAEYRTGTLALSTTEEPDASLNYFMRPLDPAGADDLFLLIAREDQQLQEQEAHQFWHTFLNDMAEELRLPLERALIYEDLYDQARRDLLTGLVNRRVFEERIEHEMANAQRYKHSLVMAALDLDHFKQINDRMGHAEGDEALRRVSQVLRDGIRDSDILARIGGDEFALLLPNTPLTSAYHLTLRLCQAVSDLGIHAPQSPALGVSIGLACWKYGTPHEEWKNQADQALYRAKAAGRCCVSL
ncbi:MAG: GGDEF domain-containing protein [Magnetococcales bacterium]|nr:GGDEF domain-containing protein [Magnetococcales bacterium]